jgi:hypothetical protein
MWSSQSAKLRKIEQSLFGSNLGPRKAKAWESFITYQSMIHGLYLPNPRNRENKQTKDRLNLMLNSPCYNLTVTVNSSDRWTPFFSVPRWYDAVALPCHLFSRDHDHVAETSRADHYRALCGNRRISPLVPTSDGWDDRCALLSYKKGNPSVVLPLPSLTCFRARRCLYSCFPLRLVFGHPATSPSPLLLRPITEQAFFAIFVDDLQKKLEEDRKKNPNCIADHASVRRNVRVPPLDACSDVSLHRRRSLSSCSFPCTHSSTASSWTALRQWGEHHVSFAPSEFSLPVNVSEYVSHLL